MRAQETTRVPCSKATRERLRRAKRAGDTYDEVICKALDQYDPEQALKADEDGTLSSQN